MKYKYFHNGDFKWILKLVSSKKLEQAKIQFEMYLEKYPEDSRVYPYYIDVLIKLNELELAEEMISVLEKISEKHIEFYDKLEMISRLEIKLFSHSKRYEECYILLKKNENLLIDEDSTYSSYEILSLFLDKKLGIDSSECIGESYLYQQLLDYSVERFFEHVVKHQYNPDSDENFSCFSKNFPLKHICLKLMELLPFDDGKQNNGLVDSIYTFRYDCCGRYNCKVVNYFRIVVFANSNEMITMYPYDNKERCEYVDLNYMNNEIEEMPKVKRMSQIEKFYQRYGKKVDNN